jgi:hypothetical protein
MVKKRERNLLLALAGVAALAVAYVSTRSNGHPVVAPVAADGRGPRASEPELPRVGLDRVRPASARPPVGRDIFDFGGPDPAQLAQEQQQLQQQQEQDPEPTPTPVPTPTPLPALNVKYIGSVEKKGLKVAVFMTDKKEIVSGQAGETVMNRFRVVRIGLESVDVQQVGADQVQRLPLKGN